MTPELSRLYERRQLGSKFSLDRMISLCRDLGNPEKSLRFIHIAGTNGKGSVAAMCAAILQEAGLKTGLYTSPHLIRYHERFRIDGCEITDQELDPILSKILKVAGDATFFEITTAAALLWFVQKKVEVVVWETGLGGRFDATNVVAPSISVITKIGLDHMQFLGKSLEQIASEKAGIIKKKVSVVVCSQEPAVMKVLEEKARECEAELLVVSEKDLDEFPSPLVGDHQCWNTALAVAAVRNCDLATSYFPLSRSADGAAPSGAFLKMEGAAPSALGRKEKKKNIEPIQDIKDSIIRSGLEKTKWMGRCQEILRDSKPPILLDGAHNPLGMEVLVKEVERRWGKGEATFILGMLRDKELAQAGKILRGFPRTLILVPVQSERTASLEEIEQAFPEGLRTFSLKQAMDLADQKGDPVVITGSLFLVGEALKILGGLQEPLHPNEKLVATISEPEAEVRQDWCN